MIMMSYFLLKNQNHMSERLDRLSLNLATVQNRLLEWRKKYPLNRQAFRELFYSSKYRKIVDDSLNILLKNPHVFKHSNIEDYSFAQERKSAAQMIMMVNKLRPINLKDALQGNYHSNFMVTHALYQFDPGLSVKADITFFLYAKALASLAGNHPVQKQFVRKALTFEQIGCFGLTQIGHGSNVKGILTEAIYDHEKKQYVMNTPCKQGMKFWIGASSEVATMAVIWAQLVIEGKKYGPHAFIVPIRDPKTHLAYDGVTIGDCGPKNGLTNIDNGYILFSNYRIPKQNGLDKFSGVDENGIFRARFQNPQKLFGLYMSPQVWLNIIMTYLFHKIRTLIELIENILFKFNRKESIY